MGYNVSKRASSVGKTVIGLLLRSGMSLPFQGIYFALKKAFFIKKEGVKRVLVRYTPVLLYGG